MPTSSGFTPLGAERAATADRENRRIEKSDEKAMRNDLQAIMGIADVETREAIRARLELASASWQCWPVQGHA